MATIDDQIISVTRTCYGVRLDTDNKLGLKHNVVANSTLNELLEIQASATLTTSERPVMKYLVIGNLGHLTITGDDGSDETIPIPHYADDAAPWGLIPFALREVSDDLPAELRNQLRLRRVETYNDKTYYAYYGFVIDLSNVTSQLEEIITVDGIATTKVFAPTSKNLNPKRPEISNSGVILGSDRSVSAMAIVPITLTAAIIAEITNAHRIRTNSQRSPVLSELCFCSGVDRQVQGATTGSGTFTYSEVIACEVNLFLSTMHPVAYASNGLDIAVDVGGAEPMLAADSVNSATFLT